MFKKILDAHGKTVSTLYIDDGEGKVHIQNVQDVTAIAARNQRILNEQSRYKHYKKPTFYEVAHVPVEVVNQWIKEGIKLSDSEAINRKLNDPANRFWRTAPGTL